MTHEKAAQKKTGFHTLRKSCLKKMLDLDYDRAGSLVILAEKLDVNYRSLSMALTGHRVTPRTIEILCKLRAMLDEETASRGNIHNIKQTSNQIHRRLSV